MNGRDMPALVLVHGGAHAGDCWDLTVRELHSRDPDVAVLAIDLPGRAGVPGDLMSTTLSQWLDAAIAQIDGANLDRVVLVGHSLAGLTLPRVAAKLGPDRVQGMVFVACAVPPEGGALVDTLRGPLRRYGVWVGRRGEPLIAPTWLARYLFCNGMTPAQRAFTLARCVPECATIFLERIHRRDLPDAIPRTWILTTRDRAMTPRAQRAGIVALGRVERVIEVDSGHNVMVGKPGWLADVLLEHRRRWT